ncbi:helix-turn-helix domain-containing protein [uncultured Sphingomonas sp.]|uniref:helix-turn-helix domain-containing protein n=1 Tax=uncultured Sphingomonas sp. TaxID=158754 RepID=UPI0025FBAC8A|nr:helix-turn-helix domain-containing protein [uncultured Sphingomonas sp.]
MAFSLRWADYKACRFLRPSGEFVKLSPTEMEILSVLMLRRTVASTELFDIVYGDKPDGGPLWGENSMTSHVSNLNKKLAPDWKIQGWPHTRLYDLIDLHAPNALLREYRKAA